MPLQDDEAPRLAEIGRRIHEVGQNLSDFRNEVRSNFSEMVRRETYVAERDALKERVVALEQRARSMQSLLYGALASIAVALVLMWITRGA
jgi:hypothetical protein